LVAGLKDANNKLAAQHKKVAPRQRRLSSIGKLEPFGYSIPWFFVHQGTMIRDMAKPSPQFAGDPVLMALGAAIRRARSAKGLSQEALAVDADLDRSYMGGIERGEHNLTLMNLVKIAGALKVRASNLLAESEI
jgi:DNA-binding XRE family transcriptional regulator